MKYKRVPCLVLDDWGKEKTTEARLDYLFQIIDYRYRNGLQTILTTNAFNMEGLKKRWNADMIEPLVSRILENGAWVTIHASENFRLKKTEKQPQEVRQPNEEKIVVEAETLPEMEVNFSEAEVQHGVLTEEPEVPVEKHAVSERKSWEEISESAEYKAKSEHDKILAQWEYFKASPEYENLTAYDKQAVQIEFTRRLNQSQKIQTGYVINVPVYDDGLDDVDTQAY